MSGRRCSPLPWMVSGRPMPMHGDGSQVRCLTYVDDYIEVRGQEFPAGSGEIAAVLLERQVPGYREIVATELPFFVKESTALVFGRKFAETTARRSLRAAASLWVDARPREDLVAPTCLFAMQYLRYMAEDSESWDETKEHESQTTREEELIRQTSSVAFAALCAERPGNRWPVLQTIGDALALPGLELVIELTGEGGQLMQRFTQEHLQEFMPITLDGEVISSPKVQSAIASQGRLPSRSTRAFGARRAFSASMALPALLSCQ